MKHIITDIDLEYFYRDLIVKCDKADDEPDVFIALGMIAEIETLMEGVNSTVSHQRRCQAIKRAFA